MFSIMSMYTLLADAVLAHFAQGFCIPRLLAFCRAILLSFFNMSSASTSQMSTAARALCYSLRNPPAGVTRVPCKTIIAERMVTKKDGTVPSQGAISKAALSFMVTKDDTCVHKIIRT